MAPKPKRTPAITLPSTGILLEAELKKENPKWPGTWSTRHLRLEKGEKSSAPHTRDWTACRVGKGVDEQGHRVNESWWSYEQTKGAKVVHTRTCTVACHGPVRAHGAAGRCWWPETKESHDHAAGQESSRSVRGVYGRQGHTHAQSAELLQIERLSCCCVQDYCMH